MNNNPLVTVLMPVYNAAAYLSASIESILNQTFTDFEFLIINDGSTDNSELIIKRYQDSRIRYYKNATNQKLIETLNKGLTLAKGVFIARMDADDIALPERLERQVHLMQKRPDISICGSLALTFSDKGILDKRMLPENPEALKCICFFQCPVLHPATMIRRFDLEQLGMRYNKNYPHAEDLKLWSDAMKQGLLFYNIQTILFHYRYNPHSVSNLYREKQTATSVKILKENIAFYFPAIDITTHSTLIENLQDRLVMDNDFRSFRKVDTFFALLAEQNKGAFDAILFRKILIDKWRLRLLEMEESVLLEAILIFQSKLLSGHKRPFLIKMRTVYHVFRRFIKDVMLFFKKLGFRTFL